MARLAFVATYAGETRVAVTSTGRHAAPVVVASDVCVTEHTRSIIVVVVSGAVGTVRSRISRLANTSAIRLRGPVAIAGRSVGKFADGASVTPIARTFVAKTNLGS